MTNFIVVQNRDDPAQTDLVLEHILAIPTNSVTLIGRATALTISRTISVVATEGRTLGRCLAETLILNNGQVAFVLNGSVPLEASQVSILSESAEQTKSADLVWFETVVGNLKGDLPELSIGGLVPLVTAHENWPLVALAIRPCWTHDNQVVEGGSIEEIMARIIIRAVTDGREISRGNGLMLTAKNPQLPALSSTARANLLNSILENANIEDTFPQHDWRNHQAESAAASYHLVAAYFIRLGDMESAQACLRLGDQLEESPRSLALKAIIARDRGEILGAVANMISSLQQYELRKRAPEPHYVRFAPKNLEVINESLNAGLNALNRRENEHALAHFSEAVGSFDSFYELTGLHLGKEAT